MNYQNCHFQLCPLFSFSSLYAPSIGETTFKSLNGEGGYLLGTTIAALYTWLHQSAEITTWHDSHVNGHNVCADPESRHHRFVVPQLSLAITESDHHINQRLKFPANESFRDRPLTAESDHQTRIGMGIIDCLPNGMSSDCSLHSIPTRALVRDKSLCELCLTLFN